MNAKAKDQFIVAYFRNLYDTETTLSYAYALSAILNKGLILLSIFENNSDPKTIQEAEEKLKAIKESSPSVFSYLVITGNAKTIIHGLPDKIGAVCFVSSVSEQENTLPKIRALLKPFSESKVAYILAKEPLTDISQLKKIAMTIDYERSSKEKVIWAGYFGRFHQSAIHVVHCSYKDEFLRKKVGENRAFVSKILSGFNIDFSFSPITSGYTSIDKRAFDMPLVNQTGLFISLCSKSRNPFHLFTGRTEEYLIKKQKNIPLLFLNPRKDLYVLCD